MTRLWRWLLFYFGVGNDHEEPRLRPRDRVVLAAASLLLLAVLVVWWGWTALLAGLLAVVAVRLYDRFGRRPSARGERG